MNGRSKTYIIDGDPVPLARARFTRGRAWDSQKQLKLIWGLQLSKLHGREPMFIGPLAIDIKFMMPIPPSRRRKNLHATPHIFKPDCDNLIKYVLDCCQSVIFEDDCIVAEIIASKYYDHGLPRTIFTVREIK